ncbi:hypothetical protein ACI782_09620 [Geodermatophilus sp. SYSU D00703]
MSPGTAREHVRVARALIVPPRIGAAFAAGRLPYSKVRALTRVAEPETEAELLEFALEATASQTERVVHAGAAVLADDAAAGRAHLEAGPALQPADVRRMLCEATVVTMLAAGREPPAVGRARRLATRAQRRALLRRDGGCARPGCPPTTCGTGSSGVTAVSGAAPSPVPLGSAP